MIVRTFTSIIAEGNIGSCQGKVRFFQNNQSDNYVTGSCYEKDIVMCQSSSTMMKNDLVKESSLQPAVVQQRVVLNIQILQAGAGRSRQAVSEDLGVFTNLRLQGVAEMYEKVAVA